MSFTASRRGFLKTAGLAAFPLMLPARARGAVAPSNRIALGFIGTGDHGVGMNLNTFLQQADAQVVVVCDVDQERMRAAQELVNRHYAQQQPSGTFTGCDAVSDWREVIARRDVDAVVVSTPDHWHVLPSIAAARAGKDVFCEKPLTLTVHEGRMLSDTMRQYGRIFQTASENRSKGNFLRAAELVRNGRIGTLQTIYTQLPVDPTARSMQNKPFSVEPVPEGFDYNLWLGPAPEAPYTKGRCHYHFRWIFDYSGGSLTDWGAHINDIAQWANNTEYSGPISVEGEGIFPREGLYNTAIAWKLTYEYANGVTLICTDGSPKIRLEGSDGWLECTWDSIEASSRSLLHSVIGPEEIRLRTCPGREQRDFLDCVKSRAQTYAPAEIGHRTVTISHIGNIAMKLDRKLHWDPDTELFTNDPLANRLLARPMREPWQL